MSMIDKKGKIFGKLNIIDLIAILLIVAVLALIGYKLLVRSPGGLAGEGQAVVYTVEVKGVEPEVYEFIQKQLPSQLMAANELLDASVTDVTATPVEHDTYAMMWNANLGVETLTQVDAGTYNLVFTIEGTVKDNLSSELGTQEIPCGQVPYCETATFELEGGIITSVNGRRPPRTERRRSKCQPTRKQRCRRTSGPAAHFYSGCAESRGWTCPDCISGIYR